MKFRTRLAAILVVLAGAWLVAGPAHLGGGATYVTTEGSSMAPSFRTGDLAVLRPADRYRVGDVVAYRSDDLKTLVMHRIVAVEGDRFVLQGDNNSWLDPERPTREQLVGTLALRIPQGGTWLARLTSPTALGGLAFLLLAGGGSAAEARRRRRTGMPPARAVPRPSGGGHYGARIDGRTWGMSPKTALDVRAACAWVALAGLALLALGAYALTRPTTDDSGREVVFTQRGAFSYAAPAAPPLYPDGIATGDPVFLRLAEALDVAFTHTLSTEAADADVEGTVALDAVLSGAGGWERSLPLVDPRPLAGEETSVTATLDLPRLRELATEAAELTGAPAGNLAVTVTARVQLTGTVAGQPVDDAFSPTLPFTLDEVALRPTGPGEQGADVAPTGEGTVTVAASEPAVLPLPGPDLTVTAARAAGLGGGLALLALAGVLALATRPRAGAGESDRIAARFGSLLVPIAGAGGATNATVVDVASFEALARVAQHHERLVLHLEVDGHHTYLVELQGTEYRYRASS